MQYPTTEQVESADHVQLASWYRFLPSPGARAMSQGMTAFNAALTEDRLVLDRIVERFNALGGMTPKISKHIGF